LRPPARIGRGRLGISRSTWCPTLPETLIADREREYAGSFLKAKALAPGTFDDAELGHYAAAEAVAAAIAGFIGGGD
jgi:hypothetical protein